MLENKDLLKEQEQNKTFCVYPWMHQVVLPTGTVGFCCVAQNGGPVFDQNGQHIKVPSSSLKDAWNSAYQTQIRKQMLLGQKVDACKLCYYQESIGKDSYRKMHNREWLSKDEKEIEDRIKQSQMYDGVVEGGPVYLDLRLGNLCNLKCRMCNPYNSSKIAAETDRLLQTDEKFRNVYQRFLGTQIGRVPKWYEDEAFWNGLYNQLSSLRKVYLTGGEPTLIKKNYEFLKKCIDTGHSRHIVLMFNINCTHVPDEFLSTFPHFESVIINVSLDGVGEANNYIRNGSDWGSVDQNFRKLVKAKGPLIISVTPTIQLYNVLSLVGLLDYAHEVVKSEARHLDFDFLYVTDPQFLDVRLAPHSVRQRVLAQIKDFKSRSQKWLDRAKNLQNSLSSFENLLSQAEIVDEQKIRDFVDYTKSLDAARGENFSQALPSIWRFLKSEGWDV